MKKQVGILVLILCLIGSVFSTPVYAGGTESGFPNEISLYVLDEKYEGQMEIPDSYTTSYKIIPPQDMKSDVKYTIKSGYSVTVSPEG